MKDLLKPFLPFMLIGGFAFAQSIGPMGPYGFLANLQTNDPADNQGAAIVGVMNFDGVGNLTGGYTLQMGRGGGAAQTVPGALSGSYTVNPDGTGTINLTLDVGAGLTFAYVTTDSGQGLQFLATGGSGGANNLGGGFIPLQGSTQSLTGSFPAALFLGGNTSGNVNLSLSGAASGAPVIFTGQNTTSSGTSDCGPWTVKVTALTVALNPGSSLSGDYVLALSVSSCGDNFSQIDSGQVTGAINAAGAVNLVLHVPGNFITGFARAAQGGSPNGSYGVLLNVAPIPSGTVGVMSFDGAGNVSYSFTTVGAPGMSLTLPSGTGIRTGTYSVNPDGTGTITFPSTATGQATTTFSFVVTDGGSGILLVRTDPNPGTNVWTGTGRLQ